MRKDEAIKIRVPLAIKNALKALADSRFTSESEIAREALLAYLTARGISPDSLRDAPASSHPAHSAHSARPASPSPADAAALKQISYLAPAPGGKRRAAHLKAPRASGAKT